MSPDVSRCHHRSVVSVKLTSTTRADPRCPWKSRRPCKWALQKVALSPLIENRLIGGKEEADEAAGFRQLVEQCKDHFVYHSYSFIIYLETEMTKIPSSFEPFGEVNSSNPDAVDSGGAEGAQLFEVVVCRPRMINARMN